MPFMLDDVTLILKPRQAIDLLGVGYEFKALRLIKQEMPTNCGTKAADVLDGKL